MISKLTEYFTNDSLDDFKKIEINLEKLEILAQQFQFKDENVLKIIEQKYIHLKEQYVSELT